MIRYGVRLSSITIDADGSPSGYIAWYNHSTGEPGIKILRPPARNEKYGVQRMEMLAIYFAIVKNQRQISMLASSQKRKQIVVNIRSDSKTCIEQLQGISKVRDAVLQRICTSIRKLLDRMPYMIIFNYLERARNHAGLLLERRRRKEIEEDLMHRYQKQYYYSSASGFMMMNHYYSGSLATA
ncbi:hypothetical protein Ngar_c14410 [Candidatus Nitrososphaera gargensis Ga9.2]|uniref:RNase H type-1 domain-containing protein n=1 Tax=Nitrososphaera gargensis (strain Ga9.2) TaxID=1237085 RepID=K0IJE1_NITGG|nr:hypothetical protein [Candidatus Nitrososphaera gargensis]AFU58377.1 hypothetical protein Ngar_c14410 [Candidatus Nitrososphaera gargensis Ga9.2]